MADLSRIEKIVGIKKTKAGVGKLNAVGKSFDRIIGLTNQLEAELKKISSAKLHISSNKIELMRKRSEWIRKDSENIALKLAMVELLFRDELGKTIGSIKGACNGNKYDEAEEKNKKGVTFKKL